MFCRLVMMIMMMREWFRNENSLNYMEQSDCWRWFRGWTERISSREGKQKALGFEIQSSRRYISHGIVVGWTSSSCVYVEHMRKALFGERADSGLHMMSSSRCHTTNDMHFICVYWRGFSHLICFISSLIMIIHYVISLRVLCFEVLKWNYSKI